MLDDFGVIDYSYNLIASADSFILVWCGDPKKLVYYIDLLRFVIVLLSKNLDLLKLTWSFNLNLL